MQLTLKNMHTLLEQIASLAIVPVIKIEDAIPLAKAYPGLNPKIVKYCVDKGILITPSCANPSDIEQALELGLEVVKFFPAEAADGIKMIKAISASYTKVKFMPTGGINATSEKEAIDIARYDRL